MALTKEQTERLHELEEIVEGGIGGMMLPVYLDNYSDGAIWKLGRWAEALSETSPKLGEWLHSIAVEELYRRGSSTPIEVKTPRLPVTWTNSELGAALLDAYRLAQSNQLKELDPFFAELNMLLAVQTASRLEKS